MDSMKSIKANNLNMLWEIRPNIKDLRISDFRTQNPVGLTPRAGSIPAFGTIYVVDIISVMWS